MPWLHLWLGEWSIATHVLERHHVFWASKTVVRPAYSTVILPGFTICESTPSMRHDVRIKRLLSSGCARNILEEHHVWRRPPCLCNHLHLHPRGSPSPFRFASSTDRHSVGLRTNDRLGILISSSATGTPAVPDVQHSATVAQADFCFDAYLPLFGPIWTVNVEVFCGDWHRTAKFKLRIRLFPYL